MKIFLLFGATLTLLFLTTCTKTVTEASLFYPRPFPLLPDVVQRENVELVTPDSIHLHGWWLHSPKNTRSILFFYGNGMLLVESEWFMYQLAEKTNSNILAFDYRGYGSSGGKPGFKSIMGDAVQEFDLLKQKAGNQPVFIYGWSIGTVFATKVAKERTSDGVILCGAPSSAQDAITSTFENFPWYIRLFVRVKPEPALLEPALQPVNMIEQVHSPVFIIHGEKDEMLPVALGRKLFDHATGTGSKHFIEVPKRGHTPDLPLYDPYLDSLKAFMK